MTPILDLVIFLGGFQLFRQLRHVSNAKLLSMPPLSNAHLANKVVCGECVLVHHPEVDPSRGDVAVNLEDQKLDVQRAW